MKTYNIVFAILAIMTIGCSKSSDAIGSEEIDNFQKADYVLLLKSNEEIASQLLNISKSKVSLSTVNSNFERAVFPTLVLQKDSKLGYYQKLNGCSGEVVLHDFIIDSSIRVDVFPDLNDCELEVASFEYDENQLYVAYEVTNALSSAEYFLRIIDYNETTSIKTDIELSKKPLQLSIAKGFLFILTLDVGITNENSLSILQLSPNELVNEIGLVGYNVGQIFKNINQDIIIAYPELHTVLNSETWSVNYVGYDSGSEPKFHTSFNHKLDRGGRLFYRMPVANGIHSEIPAIYDFTEKLTTLYYYENFLTTDQLEEEFKIGATTMVNYDEINEVMLVGYQKKDDLNAGGLLRVQLEPEPKFLGNTNLEGVPYYSYIQE